MRDKIFFVIRRYSLSRLYNIPTNNTHIAQQLPPETQKFQIFIISIPFYYEKSAEYRYVTLYSVLSLFRVALLDPLDHHGGDTTQLCKGTNQREIRQWDIVVMHGNYDLSHYICRFANSCHADYLIIWQVYQIYIPHDNTSASNILIFKDIGQQLREIWRAMVYF